MIGRKLKILMTIHRFFPRHSGGTQRYTLDLAKSLQNMGHEVVVVTANCTRKTLLVKNGWNTVLTACG